jgi:type I restriction enzyme S subunit
MTFGGFMGLLRPHGEIDSRFLFYLTRSDLYRRLISSLSAGTNINNLKGSDLLSWEIPLPTLVEQKRIVALLDEAFAGIDQAIAKAELNLSSCKIITGLHLKSIFNQSGASDNEAWHKTKLVNIADVQSGSAFPTESQGKAPNGIPFYKVSDMNIKGNERYMINENNSITEDARKELGASIFPKGSVIFPKVGGAIATNKKRITTRECCVDNNVMGAIPKPGKMTSEFLYYFFLAYNLSEFANEAHLPSIKKTTVEEWELSVPRTTQDQERIVEKLNVITDSIQQLTRISEVKIAALAQLKSSLLVKAFAGELSS